MPTVSLEQLSRALDLNPERIRQLARSGVIPKPQKRGEYDFIPALQGYIRHLRENDGVEKPGQPTAYRPEFCTQARVLCELGAIDAELAEAFGVSRRTIAAWQTAYAEFREAMALGKDAADDRVERALYSRAIGYSHDAVKIFPPKGMAKDPLIVPYVEHIAPDTTAAIFWLKNRRSQEWRERSQHEHTGKDGQPIRFTGSIGAITADMPLAEAAQIYAQMIGAEDAGHLPQQPDNPVPALSQPPEEETT